MGVIHEELTEAAHDELVREAEALVGKTVRDYYGRIWKVTEVGSKDGWPTISGNDYWARVDDVKVEVAV